MGAGRPGRHGSSRLETRPVEQRGAGGPAGFREPGHRRSWVSLSGGRAEVHPQASGGWTGSHPRGRPPRLQLSPGAGQYCPEQSARRPRTNPAQFLGSRFAVGIRMLEGSHLVRSACRWQRRLLRRAWKNCVVLNGPSLFQKHLQRYKLFQYRTHATEFCPASRTILILQTLTMFSNILG